MKTSIFTLVLLLSLISCDKPNPNTNSCEDSGYLVNTTLFSGITSDDFDISEAQIIGDCLEIGIRVGGGCGELNYSLIADEMVIETYPEKRMIRLILDDQDNCEALLYEKILFDISNFRTGKTGTVILLLEGFDDGLEYKY